MLLIYRVCERDRAIIFPGYLHILNMMELVAPRSELVFSVFSPVTRSAIWGICEFGK